MELLNSSFISEYKVIEVFVVKNHIAQHKSVFNSVLSTKQIPKGYIELKT